MRSRKGTTVPLAECHVCVECGFGFGAHTKPKPKRNDCVQTKKKRLREQTKKKRLRANQKRNDCVGNPKLKPKPYTTHNGEDYRKHE